MDVSKIVQAPPAASAVAAAAKFAAAAACWLARFYKFDHFLDCFASCLTWISARCNVLIYLLVMCITFYFIKNFESGIVQKLFASSNWVNEKYCCQHCYNIMGRKNPCKNIVRTL